MRFLAFLAIATMAVAQSAAAASWSIISFATTAENLPQVVAAGDELMNSTAGKAFPGRLVLQQSTADGNNPATHSWVPIYASAGDREAFVAKLEADPAWNAFLAKIGKLSEPVSTVQYRTIQSTGDINDTDSVWITHAFRVDDPAGFLAAIEQWRKSETSKKFPGQVHISSVVAGGMSPVTHIISVGYASEAEMEAWTEIRNASPEWAAYIASSRKTGEYLGASLGRNLKAWGPATTQALTAQ